LSEGSNKWLYSEENFEYTINVSKILTYPANSFLNKFIAATIATYMKVNGDRYIILVTEYSTTLRHRSFAFITLISIKIISRNY
jgi:hypothetical protein